MKKHFTVFTTIFNVKNMNIMINTLSRYQKCNMLYKTINTNINTILLCCLSFNKKNFCTIIKLYRNCKDVSIHRMKIEITQIAPTKIFFYTLQAWWWPVRAEICSYFTETGLLFLQKIFALDNINYCIINYKTQLNVFYQYQFCVVWQSLGRLHLVMLLHCIVWFHCSALVLLCSHCI